MNVKDSLSFLFGGDAGERPAVPVRALHLDLKGLPPTPPRLLRLLEIIAQAHYNALLVEWEDAFAWADEQLRCQTAYAPDVIDAFHRQASELGLQVIPLVQCLGHLEMVLRVERYAPLREVSDRFGVLNPLADGARDLICRLIDDVLARSPAGLRHFHLGGDEAFTLGSHPHTRAFIDRHGKAELYLRHVEPLLDHLIQRGIRPILWHDMMHDWDASALARLGEKADLMVWGYNAHPDDAPGEVHSTRAIQRFAAAGVPMWGACAFKGADGHGDQDLPNLEARYRNAAGWADVAQRFGMKGVVATGWSRYTSLRMQCEPIDGALDALLCVAVALHGKAQMPDERTLAEALERLGERDRFQACKTALSNLSAARDEAWRALRLLRGQAAVRAADPRRRESRPDQHYLDMLDRSMRRLTDAGAQLRDGLAENVPDIWIERYLSERIDPLRHEARQIAADEKSVAP